MISLRTIFLLIIFQLQVQIFLVTHTVIFIFFSYVKQLQSYGQRPKSEHESHKYQHSTVRQSLSLTQQLSFGQ